MTLKFQLAIAGMLPVLVFAQESGKNVIYRQGTMMGGVGAQTFEYVASESFSFDGGVVKNAPYSAEAVTETTQKLADGNRISRKNNTVMYRDSEGRTRREESLPAIGPWASGAEPSPTIFINDPVSKNNFVLESKNKIARKMPAMDPAFAKIRAEHAQIETKVVRTMPAPAGRQVPDFPLIAPAVRVDLGRDSKNAQTEPLGTQMIEGVQAEGTRTTFTIPAGDMGNDLPIQIVSERWYSPELQTVVMSKHSDPRMGDTVYRLTNISRNEPSRSLFEVPADYTVTDSKSQILFKTKE